MLKLLKLRLMMKKMKRKKETKKKETKKKVEKKKVLKRVLKKRKRKSHPTGLPRLKLQLLVSKTHTSLETKLSAINSMKLNSTHS